VGFLPGEIVGMRVARVFRLAGRYELFFGELADGLQHRKPCPTRRLVGDHQRLADQRIDQIQGGELVTRIRYRLGTCEVETPCEYRASIEQCLLRGAEEVVGPLKGMAQCLMSLQPTSRAD